MLFAFDGTGCDEDKTDNQHDTNVSKFCKSYEGKTFYQPGPGTGNFWNKIWGGLTGDGGKKIVANAIQYLVEHEYYEYIDVVGASRGCALSLHFCNEVNRVFAGSRKIRFVGLFDTVASFGVPGNKINVGYTLSLPHIVENCFHAMSLDERRTLFPITRIIQDTLSEIKASNILECWFRGFHSDVLGGNGNTSLSNISLVWMLQEAIKSNVAIDEDFLFRFSKNQNPHAKCCKPLMDIIPNDKRTILVNDNAHSSVNFRAYAAKGFEGNNIPKGLRVI